MRVRFSNAVLGTLRRIYGFVGGINPANEVDLAPPIIVHDVSSETEMEQGFALQVALTSTTAGAGVAVYTAKSRAEALAENEAVARLRSRNLNPEDVDVWVRSVHAVVTTATRGNLSALRMGVMQGTEVGTGVLRMLALFDQSSSLELVSGAGAVSCYQNTVAPSSWGPDPQYPILLPDDASSGFHQVAIDGAAGAVIVTGYFDCWISPKGSRPPGV